MVLINQILMVQTYREFKEDLTGYAEAHGYTTIEQAKPFFLVGKTLDETKFQVFCDYELNLILESLENMELASEEQK